VMISVWLMFAAALLALGSLPTAPSALAEIPQESRTSAQGRGAMGAAGIALRAQGQASCPPRIGRGSAQSLRRHYDF
jgi:hypothetical protein